MLPRFYLSVVLCLPVLAQSSNHPTFEVASLKPSRSTALARLTSNPGTWSCLNCRLFDLFGHAFKVFEYQIAAPDWTKSALFDVVAKLPQGFTKAPFSVSADKDEFALMLQNLLEERLQMKAHQESREMPVYELVVAKGGPKMQERSAPAPEPPPGPALDKDGFPVIPGGTGMRVLADRGRIQFRSQTMVNVAHFISTQLDRPVLDATGLTGHYALTLSWFRDIPRNPSAGASDPLPGPTIFEAVQDQLGLKLQPAKGRSK